MDEQNLQEALERKPTGDTFTKLCQFFGSGGSAAFWEAVRMHEWERAATLCDSDPTVPQRTRDWLNRDAETHGYQSYLPSLANEE